MFLWKVFSSFFFLVESAKVHNEKSRGKEHNFVVHPPTTEDSRTRFEYVEEKVLSDAPKGFRRLQTEGESKRQDSSSVHDFVTVVADPAVFDSTTLKCLLCKSLAEELRHRIREELAKSEGKLTSGKGKTNQEERHNF